MKTRSRLVRRSFDRASAGYDRAAVVQGEIRARLLERLDLVKLAPAVVVDLGAGTGHATRALHRRYPRARVVALDLAGQMLREARRQQSWWRPFERVAADVERLPLADASVDLAFSNLMLHWCGEPDRAFAEVRRVLRVDGLFTFTTLGPDTLRELRAAWRQVDGHAHVNTFIDMHDLGDALMRAGFAEPVMDMERLTVTYPSLDALLAELKAGGSRPVDPAMRRGLTSRRALDTLRSAYPTTGAAGSTSIAATVEVVYGHAWAGATRRAAPAGEVRVPIGQLRRPRPGRS